MQIDKSTMESRELKSARKNEYRRDVQAGKLHSAVKRLAVREQGVGVDAAKRAIEAYPGQLLAQIDYLIDNIPMQEGIGRARRMGLQSISTYRKRLKAGVTHMKKLNMRPESIMDITSKQIERMFEHFFEEEKSASYLGSMNTIFRRFGVWLNKPELVPPLKYMTDDEDLIQRTTAATSPKDWMMERFLVQCKQWRATKVGVSVVRELFGVMAARGAAGAFVVTSGNFTDEAAAFSKGRNITLIDGAALLNELEDKAAAPQTSIQASAESSTPTCPDCDSPMVKRTAKRGANTGATFFGCSRYPACHGTRPIA